MPKRTKVEVSSTGPGAGQFVTDLTPDQLREIFPPGNPGVLKVDETEWKKSWGEGVEANADRWKRRTEDTKKDIVGEAIKAEPKFKSKMEEVLKNETRAKALKQITTADVIQAVKDTPAADFSAGALKRKAKFDKKIDTQFPLRVYAKEQMDKMPEGTDAQREKKMYAARRTNLAIGQFLKGIIDAAACRTAIDTACK